MSTPRLRHLHFEFSEGDDGVGTLDALGSARDDAGLAALQAEADRVLAWAWARFPHGHAPVEDGGLWDHELLTQVEPDGWRSLSLTFSAAPAFVDAFLAAFGDADAD